MNNYIIDHKYLISFLTQCSQNILKKVTIVTVLPWFSDDFSPF